MSSIYENSVIKSSALYPFAPNRIYPFSIGNDGNNGSNFDGNISEIIFYGRNLNDSERLAVEKYLSQKYQIKL